MRSDSARPSGHRERARARALAGIAGASAGEWRPSVLLARAAPSAVAAHRRRRSSASLRTVWISDLHLGAAGSRAGELLSFLARLSADRLVLVGDVVDGWALARRPHWPEAHRAVLARLVALAGEGLEVVYVCGNHDEELRAYLGREIAGLSIVDELVHETADGRRLLVVHGDRFDKVHERAPWLSGLGDRLHNLVIVCDRAIGRLTRRLGLAEPAIAGVLKRATKRVVHRLGGWEPRLEAELARRELDGIVCGHLHAPAARYLAGGALYLNDGDWVESRTALIEHRSGALELTRWRAGALETLVHVPPRRDREAAAVPVLPRAAG